MLVAGVGAATAACSKFSNSETPAAPSGPPAAGSNIVYTAVGASDAAGVGSSAVCVPFTDCPGGMGYVPVTVRALQGAIVHREAAEPRHSDGRGRAGIFRSLGAQYGRTILGNFVDNEVPFVLTDSTVTTIFGGVNDVITLVSAIGQGAGGGNAQAFIDAQVRAFTSTYASLVSGIRARAPGTRIVALNLPNVGALPVLRRAGRSISARRNSGCRSGFTTAAVNVLTSQGVTVVDLMCDSRSYLPSNYSGDFHPNDAGYAFISSEVVNAITSASYPAPQSSCPAMRAVP